MSIPEQLRSAANGCEGVDSEARLMVQAAADLELYRSALTSILFLALSINKVRTHWSGCAAEHPWCEVEAKAQYALRGAHSAKGKQ